MSVKKRNMLVQVLLVIVTFGIYAIYWFHQTATELKYLGDDTEASPTLWTVLIFIPFGAFYSFYKYSELFEKVGSEHMNKWLMFIIWLVFSPAAWFIAQSELNKRATVM